MSLAVEPRPCPTCWSTRCRAGKDSPYRHLWEDGPMAAAHAKWKDERTPPASPEEAIERGLIIKPEEPAPGETLSLQEPETLGDETLRQGTGETLSETTCAECSKPFTPVRATARFCSPACRLKAHRRAAEAPAA
jgi:hypothetical protein